MKCNEIQDKIPLLLYGELSFDAEEEIESHLASCGACRSAVESEQRLHRAFAESQHVESLGRLRQSRQELHARLRAEPRIGRTFLDLGRNLFSLRFETPAFQPVAGLALVALGFFGGRLMPDGRSLGSVSLSGITAPQTVRIRNLEPQPSGRVRIVVEETQERTLVGTLADQQIRGLLITGAKDPDDAGIRVASVDLLRTQPGESEVRSALLYAVEHDSNAGVRMKALDGLKSSIAEPSVRQVLANVLLNDDNPGVRIQVVDLLTAQTERRMLAGVLQELLTKEDNGYVRMRCQKALQEMHASLGSF